MSSPSPAHPASSDDNSLPESFASMSVPTSSDESHDCDDSSTEDFESSQRTQSEPFTPTTASSSADSPMNSHRSHSRDISFEGHESLDSANGSHGANGNGRGPNEKRPSQYDNRRNLHVDNLPPMTEVEFRNLFLTFGPIARSRIVTDAITGLPAGYGFVMFENESDAMLALQSLHNTYLPNSTKPLRVTVKKPKTAKAWEREREKEIEKQKLLAHGPVNIQTIFVNTNLYVAGLPASWTKNEMDEIFSQYGMILESRILLEKHTHQSKGVGFVRFQQLESCHQAIQSLNGKPPPVPQSLKAALSTNDANTNTAADSNNEESKQNLTVRFAVDKTAQALAVAQQTVMGTLTNHHRNTIHHHPMPHNAGHGNNQIVHHHSHSDGANSSNNSKYFSVINHGNSPQAQARSNSPLMSVNTINHGANASSPVMSSVTPQQLQNILALQQQQLARASALATIRGGHSFNVNNTTASNFHFSVSTPASSRLNDALNASLNAGNADLSSYVENALLMQQFNSPLTSSSLSLNSLAAAGALGSMNALQSLSLAPSSSNAAALSQFYASTPLASINPFTNQVFV